MPQSNEVLEIAPGKVAHVILRSRGTGGSSGALDDDCDPGSPSTDTGPESVLEDLALNAAKPELRQFLETLNEDEQASLIALVWIGRGTYAPGEIGEAIATARTKHGTNAPAYLLNLPLLPEYLEDGLEQLGVLPVYAGAETLQAADL